MTAVRLVSRFSDQRAPARNAGMQQHGEVADFLRNLVRHDGQRRDDAEVHVGQESGGDQHAVEHVVQGIADQHQRAAGLLAGPGRADQRGHVDDASPDRVLVAVIVVAVTPEQEFLEHEEQRDAGDERDAHLVHPFAAGAYHRVRNQRQQRRA